MTPICLLIPVKNENPYRVFEIPISFLKNELTKGFLRVKVPQTGFFYQHLQEIPIGLLNPYLVSRLHCACARDSWCLCNDNTHRNTAQRPHTVNLASGKTMPPYGAKALDASIRVQRIQSITYRLDSFRAIQSSRQIFDTAISCLRFNPCRPQGHQPEKYG